MNALTLFSSPRGRRRGAAGCSLLCLLLLLTSCTKEQIFPLASGRPYEVLVVLDHKTWNAPSGRALFDILDTDVPCLPQSERSFHITQIEPKDFSANFTIFRNIIQVNIDKTQFSRAGMSFMRNKYAMDQIVLTINSPSEEEFRKFCINYKQDVIDFLTRSEMNRLIKELEKKYSKVTYELAWQIFSCHFHAPKELTNYKKGEHFLWTSNNTASGMMNICIYSYPYEGPETFTKEYMTAKRDSVMKVNLPGEKPGMYMKTDTLCTMIKPIVVHKRYAMEMRGLWYMEHDAMGGPFVSHSRIDTETNRVVVAEGFVYAPEKMKRGLIRRLEGSLYTLLLPEEQYSLIDTGIEETPSPNASKGGEKKSK